MMSGRPGEARHNETCKVRMEPLLQQSDAGRNRVERAHERSNEYAARLYEQNLKKPRGGEKESVSVSKILPPDLEQKTLYTPTRKRTAPEPDDDHLMTPDAATNTSSSSTATADPASSAAAVAAAAEPLGRSGYKRAAETPPEDLADRMETEILSLNVGAAFETTAQGSISETYSPPRVVPHAEKAGLIPGWSLDLTVNDPDDNKPWDFNDPEKREKAKKLIKDGEDVDEVISYLAESLKNKLTHETTSKLKEVLSFIDKNAAQKVQDIFKKK